VLITDAKLKRAVAEKLSFAFYWVSYAFTFTGKNTEPTAP